MKLRKLGQGGMRRGDIGPIGDDIPSIFPIVFGVLLFMSTALYTTQKLDERNHYLELRKAAIGLSNIALRAGYLSDAEFDASCESQYTDFAKRRSVDFMVSLKKYCSYLTLEQSTSLPDGGPGNIFSPLTSYPLALNCPSFDPNCKNAAGECIGASCKGRICPNPAPLVKNAAGALALISQNNKPANFQTLSFPLAVQCNDDGTVRGPGLINVIIWRSSG